MLQGWERETHDFTEFEYETILPIIIKGLSKKIGKENAVTNIKMVSALSERGIRTSEPRIRKIINFIRQKGIIRNLIASNKGYWIENSLEARKKYAETMMQRADSIISSLKFIDT